MKEGNKNTWKIACIVLIVIIICLLAYIIISTNKNNISFSNSSSQKGSSKSIENNSYTRIMLDEDLSKDGKIENLENVRWNNARIRQDESSTEISIMLNNESKEEKIPARTLEVKLINKDGGIIATKEVEMQEIAENYGYTTLDLEFDFKDYVIIYDIQIVAKK